MPERLAMNTAHIHRTLACIGATLSVVLAACSDPGAARAAAEASNEAMLAQPRTVVAVVDFSGSQPSHSVAEAQRYLQRVVEKLSYGDRLVVLEMYRTGSRDSVGRFVQDMPTAMRPDAVTSYDRRELEAARRGVLNALPIFFDPELVRSVPTTDVFTTLHIAAEHLRDAGERDKELLILSDMLQSTPAFEFQGAQRMPSQGWLTAQAEQRLLPSLESACIVVIGADHTTPAGQRVRQFWDAYFQAAGAALDPGNYRLRAPTDVVSC